VVSESFRARLPCHAVEWPKKASKLETDLDFAAVQEAGLAAGLVDNKSCAIDESWQALRFVYRLEDR
jgi:hypothetical protein